MSLISKNTTPAERERGCVFSETFENAQNVARNDGTITGSPTINKGGIFSGTGEYIDYPYTRISMPNHTITVDFEFTAGRGTIQVLAQWGDGVTANSGAIVITTDDKIRFSVNNGVAVYTAAALTTGRHTITCRYGGGAGASRATAVDGVEYTLSTTSGGAGSSTAGITIGAETDHSNPFLGTIYSVKLFNNQLTLQEHIDYYNNTIYNYRNTALVDLPMNMANHDPTAGITKDISGNGFNGGFPGGSDDPTKNHYTTGYTFDGTDYFTLTDLGFTTNDPYTFSTWVTLNTTASGPTWMDFGYAHGAQLGWVIQSESNSIRLYNLGSGSITATGYPVQIDTWMHTVVRHDGTDLTLWINGDLAATSAGWNYDYDGEYRIGSEAATKWHNGNLAMLKVWDTALTNIQIKDLYQRELKQVNDK